MRNQTIDVSTGQVVVTDTRSPAEVAADDLEEERSRMVVSRFQAKAALDVQGLLTGAELVVNAEGGTTLLAWNEAVEFQRNSPTINSLASALNLTDADLDNLFRAAALIQV